MLLLSPRRNAPCLSERTARSIMTRRKHYHVYVVELSSDVLLNARFMRANPNYSPGKPCVYVGMTGLDPDVRFDKHKAGIRGNAAFAAVATFTFFGIYAPFGHTMPRTQNS